MTPAPPAQAPPRPGPAHRPHLGLVCITHSAAVRYRTITLSRYRHFPEPQREAILRELYAHNLGVLLQALSYCQAQGIRLYRVTANLFPVSDLPDGVGMGILEEMRPELALVGQQAALLGVRVVVHPDQFVVLSSTSEAVVENSITVLEHHARLFDRFGLPRSSWAAINIHGGKGGRGPELVEVIRSLEPGIRSRLTLENDERAYGAEAILEACLEAGVPMVFDAHHHVVKERLPGFEDPSVAHYVAAARRTWPDPGWQIVHLSNGRSGPHDSAHHEMALEMPSSYLAVPWIEVEAKHKETAILKLQEVLDSGLVEPLSVER